jgi:propionyl-CoA carboxylase alpha chain
VDFLSALMQHPRFRSGEITTGFIAEEYPEGFQGAPTPEKLTERLAAIAAIAGSAEAARAAEIDQRLNGPIAPNAEWVVTMDGAEHHVLIAGETVTVDGHPMTIEAPYAPGQKLIEARIGDEELTVKVDRTRSGWTYTTRGKSHKLRVLPPHVAELARHMIEKIPPDMSRFLLCPMPGLVTRIDVKAGDKVEAGQPLAVVEAMKMENILRAEKAGTVKSVEAIAGESMAVDAVILEFE